jgi:hypothetical protein
MKDSLALFLTDTNVQPSKTLVEDSVHRAKLRLNIEYNRIKTWIRNRNMFICLSNHELKKKQGETFKLFAKKGKNR